MQLDSSSVFSYHLESNIKRGREPELLIKSEKYGHRRERQINKDSEKHRGELKKEKKNSSNPKLKSERKEGKLKKGFNLRHKKRMGIKTKYNLKKKK